MPERNRFVRGLRAWAGFRQIGVTYERAARDAGEPKYGPRKLIKLALDGVFAFSTVPLRMATYLGWIVSTFAFLGAAYELLQRIFLEQLSRFGFKTVPGFPTLVITILFIGGVQLVCLGILGEYIGRIYDEVKRRPNWVVREQLGGATRRLERPEAL
jgi:dolichol-phosphate mannosyltransferase